MSTIPTSCKCKSKFLKDNSSSCKTLCEVEYTQHLINVILAKSIQNELDLNLVIETIRQRCLLKNSSNCNNNNNSKEIRVTTTRKRRSFKNVTLLLGFVVTLGLAGYYTPMMKEGLGEIDWKLSTRRCLLPNNYLVKEVARPVANCDHLCRRVTRFQVLSNSTSNRDRLVRLAYQGRPTVVRGAIAHWPALEVFTFDFFRDLYSTIPQAYSGVDEECQFFPFRTDFRHLAEVFAMSPERAHQRGPNVKPWYIGWSNCNPEVASILRRYYEKPWFLPPDSEHSIIDWIFMGYTEIGAAMHLDYVHRPSWQAQISGSKTWNLLPPPECEHMCTGFNVTVYKGDIIFFDTNQWYHDTHIHPGEISITIGSEYD